MIDLIIKEEMINLLITMLIILIFILMYETLELGYRIGKKLRRN